MGTPNERRAAKIARRHNVPLAAVELPWLFTNCTDTDPIALPLPFVTVNGSVRTNWLPY